MNKISSTKRNANEEEKLKNNSWYQNTLKLTGYLDVHKDGKNTIIARRKFSE